jgi:predicted O-methyltransferase YrrM
MSRVERLRTTHTAAAVSGDAVISPSYPWRMEASLEAVLAEYEERQAEEDVLIAQLSPDDLGRRRDELLACVGRPTGVLLNLLARASQAQSILELGTAAGYSTLWLAEAARSTGGRVTTVDRIATKQRAAVAALERAGLRDVVDVRTQDAFEFLTTTGDIYDFVLLDLWKQSYIPALDALLDHLEAGATIITDNMLEPPVVRWAARRYQRHLRNISQLDTVVLPIGSGVAVTRYRTPR